MITFAITRYLQRDMRMRDSPCFLSISSRRLYTLISVSGGVHHVSYVGFRTRSRYQGPTSCPSSVVLGARSDYVVARQMDCLDPHIALFGKTGVLVQDAQLG